MKIKAMYSLACMAYRLILRDLLKEAIDDPKKEWDDWVMSFCDKLFAYEGQRHHKSKKRIMTESKTKKGLNGQLAALDEKLIGIAGNAPATD